MFLCDDCHKGCACFTFMKSYGRCEGCLKPAVCTDCKTNHRPPPKVKHV